MGMKICARPIFSICVEERYDVDLQFLSKWKTKEKISIVFTRDSEYGRKDNREFSIYDFCKGYPSISDAILIMREIDHMVSMYGDVFLNLFYNSKKRSIHIDYMRKKVENYKNFLSLFKKNKRDIISQDLKKLRDENKISSSQYETFKEQLCHIDIKNKYDITEFISENLGISETKYEEYLKSNAIKLAFKDEEAIEWMKLDDFK